MFPWWGQKDNRTLLIQFLERGVYMYKRNRQAVRAFAAGLAKDAGTTVDFTVQAIFCPHACITVEHPMNASSCMPILVAVKSPAWVRHSRELLQLDNWFSLNQLPGTVVTIAA
jgi:hypothetical protein